MMQQTKSVTGAAPDRYSANAPKVPKVMGDSYMTLIQTSAHRPGVRLISGLPRTTAAVLQPQKRHRREVRSHGETPRAEQPDEGFLRHLAAVPAV